MVNLQTLYLFNKLSTGIGPNRAGDLMNTESEQIRLLKVLASQTQVA